VVSHAVLPGGGSATPFGQAQKKKKKIEVWPKGVAESPPWALGVAEPPPFGHPSIFLLFFLYYYYYYFWFFVFFVDFFFKKIKIKYVM
jgi:hypothetical protein